MDFDALFAMPGCMPGYYNMDGRFSANEGELCDVRIPG